MTGSAQAFHLDRSLQYAVKKGLTAALSKENVWLVSGGTDVGVMKLVGDIAGDMAAAGKPVPALGIGKVSWTST